MNYQQQQAVITGLNNSRFGGMTNWHLASQSEIDGLLSAKTQARLQSLGNAFTPTTYYEDPLGNFSANWIGRTGAPYFFQGRHVSMGFGKGLSSPWGYDFSSYSDDYTDPTIGAWVVTSQTVGTSPDDPVLPNPPPNCTSSPGVWYFVFVLTPGPPVPVVYVDPLVAMGYDFHVISGPSFQSVILPVLGDNLYDLHLWDSSTGSFVDSGIDLTGGVEYNFGAGGVNEFRILGVDTDLGIDPTDATAFVTGLTFIAEGIVSVTQTPLTIDIPDPVVTTINIDIYPNRTPNPVYLSRNYTLYVAVQGSADFDVTNIDSSTVLFGAIGFEASPVRAPKMRDLNGDGFLDAMYGFSTFDCGFQLGDTEGWLTGFTTDGAPVEGSDSVLVSP